MITSCDIYKITNYGSPEEEEEDRYSRIIQGLLFFRISLDDPRLFEKTHQTLSSSSYQLKKSEIYDITKRCQPLGFFLRSNRGCPFMPGLRYLLERYFVMSSTPDKCFACLSTRVLPSIPKILFE